LIYNIDWKLVAMWKYEYTISLKKRYKFIRHGTVSERQCDIYKDIKTKSNTIK